MFDNSATQLESLAKGAFLSVKDNVMTVGWGAEGYMWKKRVFVAPVRISRYTYELLKDADGFSVSFPKAGTMSEEIRYCGTKSGRDEKKLKNLSVRKSERVNSYLVDGCESYIECKLLATIPMDESMLTPEIQAFYKDGDYHILFVGEIL